MVDELEQEELSKKLSHFIENHLDEQLAEAFSEFPTAHIVDFLLEQTDTELISLIRKATPDSRGRIFSYIPKEKQYEISKILDRRDFCEIFTFMYSDARADLYQELTKEEQIELLPFLDKKTREDVIVLSAYPPETAGGIMSTDFATVLLQMTCQQAIAKIRQDAPSQKMIYYVYVVNDEMEMMGIITIKDLILSDPKAIVKDLINEHFVSVDVNDDREDVASQIEKHDLVAIPVLNSLKQLVGIVTHEEAIDIIRAEHTEDMEKFMGIVPTEEEHGYLETSSIHHFKKRVLWLVILAGVGLISGVIIQHYQGVLEHFIILALYMPMMTATGGNMGSQAATVVIRAIALDQVKDADWIKIIFKELKISLLLSLCVGGLVFLKILLFSNQSLPKETSFLFVGLVIGSAIAMQVVCSAVIGAGLPLLVRYFKGDPAIAASPAITTTVDITGLLIYFTIASQAFGM